MAFNDYERYKFENACIVNGRTDFNGNFIAAAGMEAIANICWDINPSMPGRLLLLIFVSL
jgi:hypothetical protein